MKITKTAENLGGVTYHIFVPDIDRLNLKIHEVEADEMSKMGASKVISDNLMALHILARKIEEAEL